LIDAREIALNSRTESIALPASNQDYFKIVLTQTGNLTAQVEATGGTVSLALYDVNGLPIVQSNGQAADPTHPILTHGLIGSDDGTVYYLKVTPLQGAFVQYRLTTRFTPSVSDLQENPIDGGVMRIANGDFNGDGLVDIVTGNWRTLSRQFSVLLNNGDGTF